jgi:Zn-dependent peptidase ImmA (M78 family)
MKKANMPNPMVALYGRLRCVGLQKKYVLATILPEWWEDEAALNPGGYAQGLTMLSRYAGLDFATLTDESRPVQFRDLGACKFKKSKSTNIDEIALVRAVATRAAQLVGAAAREEFRSLPKSACQVRQEILESGKPCVDLVTLVNYCWSVGIPVIHVSAFPGAKIKKADGLAAIVHGRPVIVLCRQDTFSARLLFIVAHELGHIVLGHIADETVLIDENVRKNAADHDEEQANAFASELLTGSSDAGFHTKGPWPNAEELADAARKRGAELNVDPGHIVQNYAYSMGKMPRKKNRTFWPVAQAALNILEPDRNALDLVRKKMLEEVDWSSLPDESGEFLKRITKAAKAEHEE